MRETNTSLGLGICDSKPTKSQDRVKTRSWTPFLTAFVVNPETGEPGEGYFVTGVGDAAAVRAKTHERLASGIYEPARSS